jgi:hypothetical protein
VPGGVQRAEDLLQLYSRPLHVVPQPADVCRQVCLICMYGFVFTYLCEEFSFKKLGYPFLQFFSSLT